MIGETAGGCRFALKVQAEAVAPVALQKVVGQRVGFGAAPGVDFHNAVAVAVPADHVEVNEAEHLFSGPTQCPCVDFAAPLPLLFAGEVDETHRQRRTIGGEQACDHQRRRRARGVVIRSRRAGIRRVRHRIEMAADQQHALRLR